MAWIALRMNPAVVVKKSEEKFVVADHLSSITNTLNVQVMFLGCQNEYFAVFFRFSNSIGKHAAILYP